MNLQTKIPLKSQQHNQIDYHSKLLLIGSCFVENMGEKLNYFKFQTLQNPFGILFHPQAIASFITHAINGKVYTDKDVFFQNEQWHCFEAHSHLSNPNKEALLKTLNSQIQLTSEKLKSSSHIIITLGTAWIYRFLETNSAVANCHKVSQNKFLKELLSVEEVSQSLEVIVNSIKSVNQDATIVFTVSPVRHLKDGFVENTQSKAHLIAAIHQLLNQKSEIVNLQSYYFPSYELMMDELRDYRFYAEDMIHPNQTAINYIWEKFKEVWISEKASHVMEEVDAIQKGLQHKPFNPNSESHKLFLQKLQERQEKLQTHFLHISF
ncbi:MAG: GSCFA domain-containing protein [Xanthomarina sp.]